MRVDPPGNTCKWNSYNHLDRDSILFFFETDRCRIFWSIMMIEQILQSQLITKLVISISLKKINLKEGKQVNQ